MIKSQLPYHLAKSAFGAAGRICTLCLNVRSVALYLGELQRYLENRVRVARANCGVAAHPPTDEDPTHFGALWRTRTLNRKIRNLLLCPVGLKGRLEEDKRLELLRRFRLLVVFKTTALPIRLNLPFGGKGKNWTCIFRLSAERSTIELRSHIWWSTSVTIRPDWVESPVTSPDVQWTSLGGYVRLALTNL